MLCSSTIQKKDTLMQFRKPELIPLVFIIFAVSVLTSLGAWQLKRLEWKNNELTRIEAAKNLPMLGNLPESLDGLEYRHVVLTGSYIHDKTLHMVGRPQGEGQGFYMVTPFKLDDDGRIIIVNRGFSPPNLETKPEGLQTLTGIIRPARLKRMFAPENQPEKNVWFYEDISAMSQATGQTLTPLIVEATGEVDKGVYPKPHNGIISLRNDHFNYAITWFSLALVGIIMFAFYQRKK
jgi:surfeit locus 1 family protein